MAIGGSLARTSCRGPWRTSSCAILAVALRLTCVLPNVECDGSRRVPQNSSGVPRQYHGLREANNSVSVPQPSPIVRASDYGVDVSFPIHHGILNSSVNPLGNRLFFYRQFMKGCYDYYADTSGCDEAEQLRMEGNRRQPAGMKNYTKLGFAKLRAPQEMYQWLLDFFVTNKHRENDEYVVEGDTIMNHWESVPTMVSVEDYTLTGGGQKFKESLWDASRNMIKDWTGQDLSPSSLYGIRIYKNGAVLSPHVDSNPLISSCIINVDQDVDEEWPLEVYGHDGRAHNVTMKPGDMVLYESHSVVHGRPFPLKGRYFANIFIHFEPTPREGMDHQFEVPEFIVRGSEGERYWREMYAPLLEEGSFDGSSFGDASVEGQGEENVAGDAVSAARAAAASGDLDTIRTISGASLDLLLEQVDMNGWNCLHEAARGGHVPIVEFLINQGADVNARTNSADRKSTPLGWALSTVGESHPVVSLLMKHGAQSIDEL